MVKQARLGHKVRKLRRARGLSQSLTAKRLEISPSYLNLIEHNRRPIPFPLLIKMAGLLEVDINAFSDDDEARLAADLSEAFGDAMFAKANVTADDINEMCCALPQVGRAFLELYAAFGSARDNARVLSERLANDCFMSASVHELLTVLTSIRSFSEILHDNADLDPERQRRFLGIIVQESENLTDTIKQLQAFANESGLEGAEGGKLATDEVADFIERNGNYFPPLEEAAEELSPEDAIDACMADSALTSEEARVLCRQTLTKYFDDAVLAPYDDFLCAARDVRYDIELLQNRFSLSLEQVCRRLTSLRKPAAQGVPFYFLRIDIAGNVSERFSGSSLRIPRFGGICPRWNVHSAFMAAGSLTSQLAVLPDGAAYFCLARAISQRQGGHQSPVSHFAIGIGCDAAYANQLVYADGIDLSNLKAATPIGLTCRMCERADCEQRAHPMLAREAP